MGQVTNRIVGHLGAVTLRDLSAARQRMWQTWPRANGRSPATRKAGLAVLTTALQKAWKCELMPSNPATLVDPPRTPRSRRRRARPTLDDPSLSP